MNKKCEFSKIELNCSSPLSKTAATASENCAENLQPNKVAVFLEADKKKSVPFDNAVLGERAAAENGLLSERAARGKPAQSTSLDQTMNLSCNAHAHCHDHRQQVIGSVGDSADRSARYEIDDSQNEKDDNTSDLHIWSISGMDCASCANTIKKALERLPDVSDITITFPQGRLRLRLNGSATHRNDIETLVKKLGFDIQIDDYHQQSFTKKWWHSRKSLIAFSIGVLTLICYAAGALLPKLGFNPTAVSSIFTIGALLALLPIAKKAIISFAEGNHFSIEMLMLIATSAAIAINAGQEALIVVLLYAVGEVLEQLAASHARKGITSVGSFMPKTVLVENAGKIDEVDASTLTIGQIIVSRPGERIGADGTVVSGETTVDEATITGESVAINKKVGSKVFAGSINLDATIRICAETLAKDNTISRMIKLVEDAEANKAATIRLIDKFSQFYSPIIVFIALLIAVIPALFDGLWLQWIYRAAAVLLIGCPCALVISVPTAIAAGIAHLSYNGTMIKGGNILEKLAKITLVAFDKTGTLTLGSPLVTDSHFSTLNEGDALSLIYAVERESNHPLASALVRFCENKGVKPCVVTGVRHLVGQGMAATKNEKPVFIGAPRCARGFGHINADVAKQIEKLENEGRTVIVALYDHQFIGYIALRDEPRPDASRSLELLKQRGLACVMLTGDNRKTAEAIGKKLGLFVHSELKPEAKVDLIKRLSNNHRVLMVGDGINDAPALAQADVGIAMGNATALALETADGAFLRGRIDDVARLLLYAKDVKQIITQNIVIALGLKLIFLVTTITGSTGLWMAIVADTGATLIVTLNAMRLLKSKRIKV